MTDDINQDGLPLQKTTTYNEDTQSNILNELKRVKEKEMKGRLVTMNEIQNIYLSIISDFVSKGNEAGLKLFGLQTTSSVLVKVVEGHAEFIHLVFANSLRVTG